MEMKLNPTFDCQFMIPWIGTQQTLPIGVFDFDRYSFDDFLGMVFVPLNELQPDTLYDDWFPLICRPGAEDKSLGITGEVHLRIVVSSSLVSLLFTSVWDGIRPPPSAHFQMAQLVGQVKRLMAVLQSLNLDYWGNLASDLLSYKYPFATVVVFFSLITFAVAFPSEFIIPLIFFLLTVKVCANGIEKWVEGDRAEAAAAALKTGAVGVGAGAGAGVAGGGGVGGAGANATRDNADDDDGGGVDDGTGGVKGLATDDVDDADEELDKEDEDENVGLFQKLRNLRTTLASVQNSLSAVCDKLERLQNAFRWRNNRLSRILLCILLVITILLAFIPLRALMVVLTLHFATKRLRQLKKTDKNVEEVANYLERLPTDYDLYPNKQSIPRALLKA